MARKKISIFGAGRVGSTACQLAAYKELGDIVLWNRTAEKAKGLALDLLESAPLEGFDVNILGTGDFKDTKNSDVVVVTAGTQREEGMSREDLLLKNSEIVKSIIKEAVRHSRNAVYVIVTNPLDAMVYLAMKVGKISKKKIVGMAGILDASRFASFVASELKVSVKDVNALVLGGHGDFMVPLPAHTDVNGIPLTNLLPQQKIAELVEHTRKAGAEIIGLEKESSAFYAPASSLVTMVESVVKDEKRILPCAAYLDGEFGLKDIFVGVPVKLGADGLEEIIELELTTEEKMQLMVSAEKIKQLINQLKLE